MEGKNGNSQLLVSSNKTSNHLGEKSGKDLLNSPASIKFRQLKRQYIKRSSRPMGIDSSYYLG